MAGEEASVSYFPVLFFIGFAYGFFCGTSRGVWNFWEFVSCDKICMIDGIESKSKCCGILLIILAWFFPLTPGWWIGAYCKLYCCTCCSNPQVLEIKIKAYKAARIGIQTMLYGPEALKGKLGDINPAAKYQQEPGQNA